MSNDEGLRPYQAEGLVNTSSLWRQGVKNVCMSLGTGGGKTRIAATAIKRASANFKRSLFVCDRINLIDQTSATFDELGIAHGVIQGQHWRCKPWERVQICSAQTLARRKWPEADLIVIDECHSVSETVRKKLLERSAYVLGLTATPFTKGLGQLYDGFVNVRTTNWMIDNGFLAPYRIFSPSQPDMTGVKIVAGEWDEKETSSRAMQVVGDCVAEYIKHGEGKKFICSAVDVAHVEELHRQFMAAGIMCSQYTYRVKDEERAEIVKEFRKPDSYIRGLITVTAASKGFDVPDIGVVIMARPLRKSLAEHIQFFGRGLRIYPGKSDVLVLDHSGNCERFWDEWNDFFANGITELDDGKRKEKPKKKEVAEEDKLTKCGNCKHLHKPLPYCPACGHVYPKKQAVQHVAGTLKELVATGNRSAMSSELWPQIVTHAITTAQPEKAEKMALAIYKKLTGTWPTKKFTDTEPTPISKEVSGQLWRMKLAYIKGREKAQRVAA